MKITFLTCTLILLSLSITAQAEPLKVKPGAWELTTVTEKKNANKPTNLDKLNPEQRDKVEKKLAEQAKKETKTAHACLREEQIKSGEVFIGKTHQGNCKRTFQTQTASDLSATMECSGVNKMSGDVVLHAADPENLNGTVKMLYGNKGEMQMLTTSDITARWVGNDCSKIVSTQSKH
jgi:DNA gyrase/topoisomerase IV subunit A